jgi:hypothetical protein
MPKSKKRAKSPKRTGASRPVGTSPTAISALTLAFGAWYRVHSEGLDDHPTPAAMLESFARAATITAALPGRHTLAHPVPDTLDALLDHLDDAAEQGSDELDDPIWEGASLVEVLDHLLDFLVETDRWRGTTAELDESSAIIRELTGDENGAGAAFFSLLMDGLQTVPEVAAADQLVSLERWSPLAAIPRFLDWLGDEQPVTATGALRLADIPVVSALLGLPEQRIVPGGSMWEIINVDPTAVRPGAGVDAWFGADEDVRLACRVSFIRHYLTSWLTVELHADTVLGAEVTVRVIGHLCVAIAPDVLPGASIDGLNAVFDEVRPDIDDPGDEGLFGDDDEELTAEVRRLSNEYATERTLAILEQFAASGALQESPVGDGTRYTVEPDRAPAFALALQQAAAGFVDDEDESGE